MKFLNKCLYCCSIGNPVVHKSWCFASASLEDREKIRRKAELKGVVCTW